MDQSRSVAALAIVFGVTSFACSLVDARRVHGQVDEDFLARYPEVTMTLEERQACTSKAMSEADLTKLRAAYEEVDSYSAYATLVTTPCVFRGELSLDGREVFFVWYPTGFLSVRLLDALEAVARFYICPGYIDEDGIYECAD